MSEVKMALLALFCVTLVSVAGFSVVKGLEKNPTPIVLGEFEVYGTKTKVVQAGECQMFIMNFTPDDPPQHNKGGHTQRPNVQFFFSCNQK